MTRRGQQITACAEPNARESSSRALIITQNIFGTVSVMWQLCNDCIGAKAAVQTGYSKSGQSRIKGVMPMAGRVGTGSVTLAKVLGRHVASANTTLVGVSRYLREECVGGHLPFNGLGRQDRACIPPPARCGQCPRGSWLA